MLDHTQENKRAENAAESLRVVLGIIPGRGCRHNIRAVDAKDHENGWYYTAAHVSMSTEAAEAIYHILGGIDPFGK